MDRIYYALSSLRINILLFRNCNCYADLPVHDKMLKNKLYIQFDAKEQG